MSMKKMLERKIKYASGVPCSHPACWAHITHPCEVCGRIQCVGDVYESPFVDGMDKKDYPEKIFILRVDPDYLVVKKDDGYGAVEYLRADKVGEMEDEEKVHNDMAEFFELLRSQPNFANFSKEFIFGTVLGEVIETYHLIRKEK